MPYDIADLKKIQIKINQNIKIMDSASDKVDYSFSNEEKLVIYNANSEDKPSNNPIDKVDSSPDISKGSVTDKRNNLQEAIPSTSKEKVNVDETIKKVENILKDLKKQRAESLEGRRIIEDISKKRSRKRYDSSSDFSIRSPSPKRTRVRNYSPESGAESRRYRESSVSTSDGSCSRISSELKKELTNILGNSFAGMRSKKDDRYTSRKSQTKEKKGYSKRDSYDRYSRKYSRSTFEGTNKKATRYDDYNRNYQRSNAIDFEERYSRYYAVMYAFSIVIDILRQDDIYSNF